jgi:hypothetical protein
VTQSRTGRHSTRANILQRKHITSPLHSPTGYCCVEKQSLFAVRTVRNTQIHCGQSVPDRRHHVSATEPNPLMPFGETVAVYCVGRMSKLEVHIQSARFKVVRTDSVLPRHAAGPHEGHVATQMGGLTPSINCGTRDSSLATKMEWIPEKVTVAQSVDSRNSSGYRSSYTPDL